MSIYWNGAVKWYSRMVSAGELERFIEEERKGKENRKAFIGFVVPEAARRIKRVAGEDVSRIMLESEGIRHSCNKAAHNLQRGDLLYFVEAVNTALDIKLSATLHQNNECLEISADRGGRIVFVVEVRPKFGGWLALVTCYRLKK